MKRLVLISSIAALSLGLVGCGSFKATDKILVNEQVQAPPVVVPQPVRLVRQQIVTQQPVRVQRVVQRVEVPRTVVQPTTVQVQVQQPKAQVIQLRYLNRVSVVRIQRALLAKGFNPGPIDGVYGVRTASAMARFQRSQGESRGVTATTLKKLGVIL